MPDSNEIAKNSINRVLINASLISHGSRIQMGIAVALITVIPLLAIFLVWQTHIEGEPLSAVSKVALGVFLILVIGAGYALIFKYPRTVMRLRDHMALIAKGELPDSIDLIDKESDISAIESYVNLIISAMKMRIIKMEEQSRLLLVAERQRIMTESLCTACHCLGQPATSIECYLQLLSREPLSDTGHNYLKICIEESGKLRESLNELQRIDQYSTEAYCEMNDAAGGQAQQIIKTHSDKAVESAR